MPEWTCQGLGSRTRCGVHVEQIFQDACIPSSHRCATIPVGRVNDDARGCTGEGLRQQSLGDDVVGGPVRSRFALVLGPVDKVRLCRVQASRGTRACCTGMRGLLHKEEGLLAQA
eukprot:1146817-Pelagomonas_calceolata.AAC.3